MTTPAFALVDDRRGDAGVGGFVRAVLGRLTWRNVLFAHVISAVMEQLSTHLTMVSGPSPPTPPPEMWISGVVITVICTMSLLLAVLAADEAVARGRGRLRAYAIAVVAGSLVGGLLQYEVRLLLDLRTLVSALPIAIRITQPAYVAFNYMIDGAIVTFVYVSLRTAALAARRFRSAELARSVARRRTLESRLQAMQARVEPTFLFNTLAQVRELYTIDVALGGTMLDELIAYLRAALPHLRESSSTLGQELELARAYLNIMRIRLGQRLSFDIRIPEGLANARLPPMMLLPLVDHALVYGLGPAHDGGTIDIATKVIGDRIVLSIADAGAGFVARDKTFGLKSIEERLDALYGDRANLRLQSHVEGRSSGSCAILEIPYERADGDHR